MAMACWRASVEDLGLDLRRDGGPALLDVRFADDIKFLETNTRRKKTCRRHIVGQSI